LGLKTSLKNVTFWECLEEREFRVVKLCLIFGFYVRKILFFKIGVLGCCAYKAWRLQDVQRENSKKKFDPSAPIFFRSIQSFFWLLIFVYLFSIFVITFCFS
jgi:hypothetical protein